MTSHALPEVHPPVGTPALQGVWVRALHRLLTALLLGPALAGAQSISDVPMAVKNNVAPNFMFMIDNSGSMSNIVPTSPYDATIDYTPAGCTGSNVLGTASQVNIQIVSGAPRMRVGSTNYRHWSLASSGSDRRCFARNSAYDSMLLADAATGNAIAFLPSEYTGNYLNWYFGNSDGPVTGWTTRKVLTSGTVQTRMEIAKASAIAVIATLPTSSTQALVRVGLSSYNGSDGGYLNVGMADLTSSVVTTLNTAINGLTPSGNTPLAETLADIGRYMATGYSGNITAGTVSGVTINNFLKQDGRQSCLANANCLTTTTDATPAPEVGTPTRPIQYWCQRSYTFMVTDGRPQADQAFTTNTYLRDYDGDCSGVNAANCTGSYDRKTSRQYESAGSDYLDDVAMALFDVDLRPNLAAPTGRTKKNNLRTYTIGFADLQVQNDPLLINTARQGGGLFLSAQDPATLTNAFRSVISDAFARDAAAAAVAVANAQITLNNTGYASSYNSGSWYGDLVAYALNTTTALQAGSDAWSLRDNLNLQSASSRKIVSYNGSSGQPFTAANFAGTPASLTAGVINYIRGDRTGEGSTYRSRQHVLGDIINAEPVVVTYSGGVPIIFQGANDGMLHVVDGQISSSSATRGQELWAYVPRQVHANLASLSSTSYSHKYFVDGTPAAADVTAGAITKLLVGGLGKGGRGYYALDISSYVAATESAAASKVLWEFAPTNMGYSFGTPLIVNTAAGWRVVVPSGYDNGSNLGGDGKGYVWVLDPQTGAIQRTMSTNSGSTSSPSGLAHLNKLANSSPSAVVRYVYGGDLDGKVWRFDLDTGNVVQIAQLADGGGTAQPVTAPPEVGMVSGSATKFMVHVGTGRYLADVDVPGTAGANTWATQQQTMYGIIDDSSVSSPSLPNIRGSNGFTCPTGGGSADFICQSFSYVSASNSYRATTHTVNTASKRGWYVDLPADTRLTNGRVISKPALTTSGTLAFTANVPTNVKCDPGGSSWYFAINSATGGAVPINAGGNTYYDAGQFLAYALASRPVLVQTADGIRALIRLSDKTVQAPKVPEPATSAAPWRRIYFRPVQ